MKTIDEIREKVHNEKTGFEVHDLLDRCLCLVTLSMVPLCERKATDHHLYCLEPGRRHPDADVIRVGFNCEDAVFNKGSKIHMPPFGLNTAWGGTVFAAAGLALRMIDYPNIYTQCACGWTQWDLDFEPVPGTKMQRCRLCGRERDLQ